MLSLILWRHASLDELPKVPSRAAHAVQRKHVLLFIHDNSRLITLPCLQYAHGASELRSVSHNMSMLRAYASAETVAQWVSGSRCQIRQ